MHIGDELEVFIYLDQDERTIATTEHPIAKVGEFAYLECAWTNEYGAFLKWGLMKDLFCPFREQKQRMEIGKTYYVYILEDEKTHRLMASAKVERTIKKPSAICIADGLSSFPKKVFSWSVDARLRLIVISREEGDEVSLFVEGVGRGGEECQEEEDETDA